MQAETCNFTKINTPPWVFFTFFKLLKCYQIVQRITYSGCSTKGVILLLFQGSTKSIQKEKNFLSGMRVASALYSFKMLCKGYTMKEATLLFLSRSTLYL